MRLKLAKWGAVVLGLGAVALRIAEYLYTVDEEGYYKNIPLADPLNRALTGVLLAAVVFLIGCGIGLFKKPAAGAMGYDTPAVRISLSFCGLAAFIHGILTLASAAGTLDQLCGIGALLGGIGLVAIALQGTLALYFGIFPTLWLCLQTVRYFWQTYKYVHISANILGMLGWCAALFFMLTLMKLLAEGYCSKGRALFAAGAAIVFLPVSFLAPLAEAPIAQTYAGAYFALTLGSLAFIMFQNLALDPPEEEEEEATEYEESLAHLQQLLKDLPETQEEEPQENKE